MHAQVFSSLFSAQLHPRRLQRLDTDSLRTEARIAAHATLSRVHQYLQACVQVEAGELALRDVSLDKSAVVTRRAAIYRDAGRMLAPLATIALVHQVDLAKPTPEKGVPLWRAEEAATKLADPLLGARDYLHFGMLALGILVHVTGLEWEQIVDAARKELVSAPA